jgi:penicillin-binding protein 2
MDLSQRKYVVSFFIVASFLLILGKLVYIQIFDESLKISAQNNSQRRITQYPARGLVYDRKGVLLVCNEAAYDLMLIPSQMTEFDTLDFISNLGIEIEDFYSRLDKAKSFSWYRPSIFFKQMTATQHAGFQESLFKYPGFFVQERTLRRYTEGIAAHVLGDVGEVTLEILKSDNYYRGGDYIGISGIEKYFERELRGQKGVKIQVVDVFNSVQGSYMDGQYDSTAIPGNNIVLTIDSDLQRYTEHLMQNKIGAVVAIEPGSGEILVLASSPTFDPQLLVGRPRGHNYDSLLNATGRPLFNRAVTATYPPGSVFKIANALVALQEGVLKPNSYIPCDQSRVGCHPHPTANTVGKSLQYSCNPYYFFAVRNLIQRGIEPSIFRDSPIGLDLWKDKIVSLGFEKAFDIGLGGVNKGQIPGSDYYDRLYGKYRWAYSTIYSLSIGQGEVLTSTLQLANFIAIVANRGFYFNPHLVKMIGEEELTGVVKHKNFTPFDKKHFEPIVEGMDDAVNKEYGTAYWTRVPGVRVCGKTGTVQNPHGENHSVFVAFAPKDNPQISIAVFIENAGYGGTWAAPVANLIIEKYLTDTILYPYREERIINASFIEN